MRIQCKHYGSNQPPVTSLVDQKYALCQPTVAGQLCDEGEQWTVPASDGMPSHATSSAYNAARTWIFKHVNHTHNHTLVCECCKDTDATQRENLIKIKKSKIWTYTPDMHWLNIPQRVQPFIGDSGIKHQCTSPTTLFHCLTLPVACDPQSTDLHVSAAATSVVAASLLMVLQSEIHCLTICSIKLLGQTGFDGIWKPICLPVVSVLLIVC